MSGEGMSGKTYLMPLGVSTSDTATVLCDSHHRVSVVKCVLLASGRFPFPASRAFIAQPS